MNDTYKKISTINKFFIGTVCFSLVTSQLYIATAEEPIDKDANDDDSAIEESTKSPITEPSAEDAVIDEDIAVAENATVLVNETAVAAVSDTDTSGINADNSLVAPLADSKLIAVYCKDATHPKPGQTSFPTTKVSVEIQNDLLQSMTVEGSLDWEKSSGSTTFQAGRTCQGTLSFTLPSGWSGWGNDSGSGVICSMETSDGVRLDYKGATFNGSQATVQFSSKIPTNTITVTGVPKPIAGQTITDFTASLTFTDSSYISDYSVASRWSEDSHGSSTYVAGSKYTFHISVVTNGISLTDTLKGLDAAYTISGPSKGSNTNEYLYTISYILPAGAINSAVLNGFNTAFKDGATNNQVSGASVTADPANSVTMSIDDWRGTFVGNKFVEGNTYTKRITVTSKSGYLFGDNFALTLSADTPIGYELKKVSAPTLNSGTGLYNTIYDLFYTVPKATKYVQTALLESVKAPVAGERPESINATLTPDLTIKGEAATNSFAPVPVKGSWAGPFEDGAFKEGSTYYFDVTIRTNEYWRLASNFTIITSELESASLQQLSLPTSNGVGNTDPLASLSKGSNALSANNFGAFSSNVVDSIKTTKAFNASFTCQKMSDTEKQVAENAPATYIYRISYNIPGESTVPDTPTPPPAPVTIGYVAELELAEIEVPIHSVTADETEVRLHCDRINDALESSVIKSKWVGKLDEYGRFLPGETYSMRLEIKTKPNWRLNDGVLFKVIRGENNSELLTPLSIDPAAGLGQYRFDSLFASGLNDLVRGSFDASRITIKKVAGPVVDGTNAAKYIYEISYTLPTSGHAIIPDDPIPGSPVVVDPADPSNTAAESPTATEVTATEREDSEVGTMSDTGDKTLTTFAATTLTAVTTSVVLLVESAYRKKKPQKK